MSNPEDIKWCVDSMRADLKMLAAPADQQIEYLNRRLGPGDCADELALEFHDDFQFLMDRAKLLPQMQIQALQTVDALLDKMSGQKLAQLWTFDALRSATEWEQVRISAAIALNLWPGESPRGENVERKGIDDD